MSFFDVQIHDMNVPRWGGSWTDASGDPVVVIGDGTVRRNQVLEQVGGFATGGDVVATAN